MAEKVQEADWRKFRELHEIALERFCERLLEDVVDISNDDDRSARDRYHDLYSLLQDFTDEVRHAFDDPRRSRLVFQLAVISRLGLLSADEFKRFSAPLRARVQALGDVHE